MRQRVTRSHVEDLLESRAVDAALIRYHADGNLEVRSTIPTGIREWDAYDIVITKMGLPLLDQSGMDFGNLGRDDLEMLAEAINSGEEA